MNKYEKIYQRLYDKKYLTDRERKEFLRELKPLIDKATPMKVKPFDYDGNDPEILAHNITYKMCPMCARGFKIVRVTFERYCPICGQALDWSRPCRECW